MEDYAIKIADYLDNTMDAAEEERFMEELGEQAELRKQYEEELVLGSFLESLSGDVPATTEMNKQAPLTAAPQWLIRYKIVAFVLLSLGAAVIITNLFTRKNKKAEKETTSNTDNKKKAQNDTIAAVPPKTAPGETIALNVFNHFYTPYSADNDPVEISMYYIAYKQHRYDAVIAVTETDFQLKGSGKKQKILNQYMHLYKGLSYLGKNNPAKAIEQFDAITMRNNTTDLFFQAKWYTVLALLKNNDSQHAAEMAMEIISSGSPYKTRAAGLLKELRAHRSG